MDDDAVPRKRAGAVRVGCDLVRGSVELPSFAAAQTVLVGDRRVPQREKLAIQIGIASVGPARPRHASIATIRRPAATSSGNDSAVPMQLFAGRRAGSSDRRRPSAGAEREKRQTGRTHGAAASKRRTSASAPDGSAELCTAMPLLIHAFAIRTTALA